jgi:hypothetical protein
MSSTLGRAAKLAVAAATSTVVLGSSTLTRADWGECADADRAALLVGALLSEVSASVYESHPRASCVIVALGEKEQADPPNEVLFRLRKVARLRVVPVSKAAQCPAAPRTWVKEPRCERGEAYVQSLRNSHCPLAFRKKGNTWEVKSQGVCE